MKAIVVHEYGGPEVIIPIGLRLPLSEAAQAHATAEKGGIGKILLLP
jgi:NADPH:quinone reductase-like Zn-dependent oxidoreductase